ncbi:MULTISPECIES: hypothetical protein [Winogradskyella]|uniref:Uncharacterized protein n=2 Tax=Winogradskyella TaxID=286104 RepID=A0A368ZIE7_9FLAO|nr:hypothetical protein [Winogradskyella arenosi]RCW92619.1 hypothetical protein DFQ08_102651 [Winogradskyella arenosi]
MAKNYTQVSSRPNLLQPKDETIRWILNYSKALNVLDCNNLESEALLN